jgi:Tetratricopeptide repeat
MPKGATLAVRTGRRCRRGCRGGPSREIGERQGEGWALNVLGAVYGRLRQHHTAIGYHEQALTIAREIKDRLGEAGALNSLGAAYKSLCRPRYLTGLPTDSLRWPKKPASGTSQGGHA